MTTDAKSGPSVAELMALVDAYADTAAVNGIRSQWVQMARGKVELALKQLPAPQAQADARDAESDYQRGYRHGYNRRWASVFGLVGQPFWFYAAWETQQWGIFALCVLYTITWSKGFYTNWISIDRAAIAAAKGE